MAGLDHRSADKCTAGHRSNDQHERCNDPHWVSANPIHGCFLCPRQFNFNSTQKSETDERAVCNSESAEQAENSHHVLLLNEIALYKGGISGRAVMRRKNVA